MKYKIFSDPEKAYKKMLSDIRAAKEEVLLETYIYSNDSVGRNFRDLLIRKASSGVRVKLLLDAWGSGVNKNFFKNLIVAGGEVRFFRKFRYALKIFNANHERNHRKLLLIDGKISYVGSMNITESCFNWRELVFRIDGDLSRTLRRSFRWTWRRFRLFGIRSVKRVSHEDFVVLQDAPLGRNITEASYKRLIRHAKKEVLIETPYFVPPMGVRKVFRKAIKRGVKIKIIMPYRSDVLLVDIFRNRHLGKLHRLGIELYYYPRQLHSKLLIIDNEYFLFGSSNLDYRSFRHQYEINLLGKNVDIISDLKKYFSSDLKKCSHFSYSAWQRRHVFSRLWEFLIGLVEEYL